VPEADPCGGIDDRSATAALEAWHGPERGSGTHAILECRRCGVRGPISAKGWCHGCAEDTRWAASNRAMCDLLHRGRGR